MGFPGRRSTRGGLPRGGSRPGDLLCLAALVLTTLLNPLVHGWSVYSVAVAAAVLVLVLAGVVLTVRARWRGRRRYWDWLVLGQAAAAVGFWLIELDGTELPGGAGLGTALLLLGGGGVFLGYVAEGVSGDPRWTWKRRGPR